MGICDTIKHTFSLMKMSWSVLRMDPELVLFPIMSLIGTVVLALTLFGTMPLTFGYSGSYSFEVKAGVILGYIVFFYFIPVFFNAALVSAAMERLRGGNPNIKSGLLAAVKKVHHLFFWAVMVAVVMTSIKALAAVSNLSERRGFRLLGLLTVFLRQLWLLATFFVIPVIVSEGKNPISSIRRSVDMMRSTWGEQLTAAFGFWFFYVMNALLAGIVGFGLGRYVDPVAGVIVGPAMFLIGIMVLQTLEGIFKAALYDYAVGYQPVVGFDLRSLQRAYLPARA